MARMFDDQVWAGTEATLAAAIRAEEARAARIEANAPWEEIESEPRLLDVQGDVAVISVKGSLNNDDDSRWNEYVGATGYPEIREAVLAAASNTEVKHILLDVDSGGGSASGVEDVTNLIRLVNDKVKPVTAYTSGSMYSAAYWLASGAGEIHASKSAGVGSIGVIATHAERSKMLADEGIAVTVIRAGKYKALANGVEPLSEDGRAQIQARVDGFYKLFIDQVSAMRGKSFEYADTVMGQGREFIGAQAADVGLVDSIITYEEMTNKLRSSIDASNKLMDTRTKQGSTLRAENIGDANMGRKTLSEQDIAALASGVSLEASVSPAETAEAPTKGGEAPTSVEASADAEPEATETLVEKEEGAVETTAEVDIAASAIKFMKEQVKESQDALTAEKIKVSKLEDKLAALEAVVSPLKDIAAKAANNMRVALGGSPLEMSAFSAEQVLSEHVSLSSSFTSKFKVGGVAAVKPDEEKKVAAYVPDSLTQARIAAVRGK